MPTCVIIGYDEGFLPRVSNVSDEYDSSMLLSNVKNILKFELVRPLS